MVYVARVWVHRPWQMPVADFRAEQSDWGMIAEDCYGHTAAAGGGSVDDLRGNLSDLRLPRQKTVVVVAGETLANGTM